MKKTIFTAMMVMCVGAAMMTGCGNIANASEPEVICGADDSAGDGSGPKCRADEDTGFRGRLRRRRDEQE